MVRLQGRVVKDWGRGFSLLLRHDGWGTATLQSGASNCATGDSRLRGNDVDGAGMTWVDAGMTEVDAGMTERVWE